MIIVKQKEADSLQETSMSPDEVIGLSGFKRVEIVGNVVHGVFDLPGGRSGTIVSGQRGFAKLNMISLSAGGHDIISISTKTVRAVHVGVKDVVFGFDGLMIAFRR